MIKIQLLNRFGSDKRQVTGALFTTFTFDPVFFEGFMYNTLFNKGVSNNAVIIIDGITYEKMFSEENKRIATGAGRFYSLIPARTGSSCFHPKIYLFSSENLLQFYIGSFNLTERGFMNNLELSGYFELNKLDKDTYKFVKLFKDVHSFFKSIHESDIIHGVSESSLKKIEKTLSTMVWMEDIQINDEEPPFNFISNIEFSIYDQILKMIDFKVKRIKILGPEFGNGIGVIKTLSEKYPEAEIQLYLRQGETNIDKEALEDFLPTHPLVKFFDIQPTQNRRIHAKYYSFEGEKEKLIFYGSANPSVSGFLQSYNKGGNIEAGIIKKYDIPSEFELLKNEKIIQSIQNISINDFISTFTEERKDEVSYQTEIVLHSAEFKDSFTLLFTLNRNIKNIFSATIHAQHPFTRQTIEIQVDKKNILEEENLKKIKLRLDEDQEKFLKETAMIRIDATFSRKEILSSNWIWLDIYSESQDDRINQAINDCGVSYVPNILMDLFLGGSEIRGNILSSLISIERGIHLETKNSQPGTSTSSGGRHVFLPPDYSKTRKTSRDIASVLEKFLNIYIYNLKRLFSSDDEEIETIIDNFSDFLLAILQVSVAVNLLAKTVTNPKIKDETEECKRIVRSSIGEIARPSLIQQLISLIDRAEISDKDRLLNIYIKKQLMIRFLYLQLFLKEHDPNYFKYMDQGDFNRLFFSIFDLEEDLIKTFYSIDNFKDMFYDEVNIIVSPLSKKPELIPANIEFYVVKKNIEDLIVLTLTHRGITGVLDYINRIKRIISSIDHRADLAPYTRFSARLSQHLDIWDKSRKKSLIYALDKKITEWKAEGYDTFKVKVIEYIKPGNK